MKRIGEVLEIKIDMKTVTAVVKKDTALFNKEEKKERNLMRGNLLFMTLTSFLPLEREHLEEFD